ncbi:hypothetical protein LR48_Vigan05g068700 [Vigna angularis]|uniref:Uncharacterized protein n=1 Tax=Phaseolus angularis TaxID=3914 RepID=A0A0L9UK01_PHAAN|nr:hypothetical protein LR48_Vigan05g068700 [Vigna angularis]
MLICCTNTVLSFEVNLVKEVKKERSGIIKGSKECKKRSRRHRSAAFTAERHSGGHGRSAEGKLAAEGKKSEARSPLSGIYR